MIDHRDALHQVIKDLVHSSGNTVKSNQTIHIETQNAIDKISKSISMGHTDIGLQMDRITAELEQVQRFQAGVSKASSVDCSERFFGCNRAA
jgi:hypothetical protein